jgi:hypothetical protein
MGRNVSRCNQWNEWDLMDYDRNCGWRMVVLEKYYSSSPLGNLCETDLCCV